MFLKRREKVIGKEALKSGLIIAHDVLDNGLSFKESARTRLRESGQNLKREAEEKINSLMKGSGYIPRGSTSNKQLLLDSRLENIGSRKRKKRDTKKVKKSKKQTRRGKKKSKGRKFKRNSPKTKNLKKTSKKSRCVADIFKK